MKKYVQCPRCELNYITTPGDKYCKVCMREMKGEGGQDDVEMCSVCNENPALPGRDICLFCLKEMNAQAAESVGAASDDSGDGDGEQVTTSARWTKFRCCRKKPTANTRRWRAK